MQLVLDLVEFVHDELPPIVPRADQLAFVVVVVVDVFGVEMGRIGPKPLFLDDCFGGVVPIASVVTIILSVVFSFVFAQLVVANALLLFSEGVDSFVSAVGQLDPAQ